MRHGAYSTCTALTHVGKLGRGLFVMDSESDFSDEDVNLQQTAPYLPALAELGLDQDFKGLDDDGGGPKFDSLTVCDACDCRLQVRQLLKRS